LTVWTKGHRLQTGKQRLAIRDKLLVCLVSYTLCLVSCVLCLTFPVHADVDMSILPGFDGFHKHGRWLPLRITLASVDENVTGDIVAETQDSATGHRQIYSTPVTLFRSTKKAQNLYVLPESFRRNLRVELVNNSGVTVAQKDAQLVTIPPEDILLLVLTQNSSGLEFLANTPKQDAVHISYSTAEPLPDKWKGYDSVDVILLGDISARTLSTAQRQAIIDWVYGGGRLIVSGGAHSQDLMGTFVEHILPVRIDGTRVLDSISSISPPFNGAQVVVASSELIDGSKAMAAESDELPIIAEKELGHGKVLFLAFDYMDPAFSHWTGKIEMWQILLPRPETRKSPRNRDIARLLSTSRSRRLPPYRIVGVFLLSYVLCFGPLNYVILKKSGKLRLMWISMPVISAVFAIGSLGFVYTTRGGAVVVNDFSVVDVYQDSGRARMSSYFSLLSPDRSDYRIEFPESDGFFVSRLSPTDSKKNQNSDCRLVEKGSFQMEILGTDVISSQLFHGESYADFSGNVSINLSESHEGVIQGEVVSNFPFDLTDCYVFSNGYRSHIGNLARGDHAQVKLDRTYTGSIAGLYSAKVGEKKRFVNSMKPGISRRISGKGLVGWVEKSALEALAGMSMSEEYKALGTMLIIVHL